MRWFSGWILTWVWDTGFPVSVPAPIPEPTVRPSPRWPPQALAAEDMKVEVGNRVEGVVAHVEDQPIPRLGDALLAGDLLRAPDQVGQESTVLGPDGSG